MKIVGFVQWCVALACLASSVHAAVPLATTDLDRRAKQSVPSSGKALLWVYRGDADAAAELPVYVNGRFMARTGPRTFMLFSLGPGRYTVTSDGRTQDALVLSAKAGEQYYVEQTASAAGEGRSTFALAPSATGRQAIGAGRLIDVRAAQAQAQAPAPKVAAPPPAAKPAPKAAPKPAPKPAAASEAAGTGGESTFAFALRSGSVSMSSTSQNLAGIAMTLDEKASGVYSVEAEYRPIPDVGVGLEVLGFNTDVSSGPTATGQMSVSSVYLNVRKLFDVSETFHPYVGAGVGGVRTAFSGNVLTGSATGIGSQVRLGVEMRFDSFLVQLEARQIWAKPKDDGSNTVDAGGRGLFAGIGFQF